MQFQRLKRKVPPSYSYPSPRKSGAVPGAPFARLIERALAFADVGMTKLMVNNFSQPAAAWCVRRYLNVANAKSCLRSGELLELRYNVGF